MHKNFPWKRWFDGKMLIFSVKIGYFFSNMVLLHEPEGCNEIASRGWMGNGSKSSRGRSPRDEDPLPIHPRDEFHCTPRAHVAKVLSHGLLYKQGMSWRQWNFYGKITQNVKFLWNQVKFDAKIAKAIKKFVKLTNFGVH